MLTWRSFLYMLIAKSGSSTVMYNLKRHDFNHNELRKGTPWIEQVTQTTGPSKNMKELKKETGREHFACQDNGLSKIFKLIISSSEKRNTGSTGSGSVITS